MSAMKAIDTHAHILSEETMRLIGKEAPQVAPKLTPIDDDFAVLEIAGAPYRPFPRGGWDMERRLKDMDFSDVDVQVLSNTPQTFLYNQDASLNATLSALQNDQIAKAVAANPDRFRHAEPIAILHPLNSGGAPTECLRARLGNCGLE